MYRYIQKWLETWWLMHVPLENIIIVSIHVTTILGLLCLYALNIYWSTRLSPLNIIIQNVEPNNFLYYSTPFLVVWDYEFYEYLDYIQSNYLIPDHETSTQKFKIMSIPSRLLV